MNHPRCAAIYARVSTDKQSQLSTADQIRKCREYAAARGLVVSDDHIYVDEAVSGVGIDRAALGRMMDAAVSPSRPFDAVLVDDTSRLTRSTKDALWIFERLNFAGVQLVAVSQGIDSDDDQAQVLVTVHGLVDSLYVKELAKKTHRGLEGLVLRGLHAGGRCFGFTAVASGAGSSKRLTINESEAVIVRRIFELSAGGVSQKAIAKKLNAECVQAPRPRAGRRPTWCPTAIRAMLKREIYKGEVVWNRSKFEKVPGTNKRRRKM
ncbi:MAG: recombinase family protein, partial [Candidatus Acidiferrales bacterium]